MAGPLRARRLRLAGPTSGTRTSTAGRRAPSWRWLSSTACGALPTRTAPPAARARHRRLDAATAEALAGRRRDGQHGAGRAGLGPRFLAWVERSKTNCIKVINEIRRRAGARSPHGRGRPFVEPKQVFMLMNDELESSSPTWPLPHLNERREAWQALDRLEPPYFVEGDKGIPPPSSLGLEGRRELRAGPARRRPGRGPGCAGIAASPGSSPTPAIRSPSSRATSSSPRRPTRRGPLFVTAAGVVGVGAMNSHAVTVSRELGIPCAVSVTGCASRIPDGAGGGRRGCRHGDAAVTAGGLPGGGAGGRVAGPAPAWHPGRLGRRRGEGGASLATPSAGSRRAGIDVAAVPPFEPRQPGQALGGARPATAAGAEAMQRLAGHRRRVRDQPSARRSRALGLDHGALRERYPSLVYASVTGYGLDGPDRIARATTSGCSGPLVDRPVARSPASCRPGSAAASAIT